MALLQRDKEPILLLTLDDLRRLYDHIDKNWSDLKNRVLTVAFGEVAIITFILSGKGIHPSSYTSAEKVFFFTGAGLLVVSFGLLIWIISTTHWIIPLDTKETKKLYKRYSSKLEYLEFLKNDYEETIDFCLAKHETRAKPFNKVLIVITSRPLQHLSRCVALYA